MLDFALAVPEGREALAEASDAAGADIAARVRAGEGLFEPVFAQLCIVATALASWRAIEKHVSGPSAIAGYSVGEVSSWGCAGSWSIGQTLSLTKRRAELMLAASPTDCTMIGVTGIDGETVDRLRGAGAHVAIEVAHDHWILAGIRADVDRAAHALAGAGATIRAIPVGVPSHTPLLESAATGLLAVVQSMQGAQPRCPVARGVDGCMLSRIGDAADALAKAVCQPIRWRAALDEAAERGIDTCLELHPGTALTRMALARGIREARGLADFRTPEGVARWLERAA